MGRNRLPVGLEAALDGVEEARDPGIAAPTHAAHLVHDIPETESRIGIGKAERTSGSGMAKRVGPKSRHHHRYGHEPEAKLHRETLHPRRKTKRDGVSRLHGGGPDNGIGRQQAMAVDRPDGARRTCGRVTGRR